MKRTARERISSPLHFVFTNVLNHMQSNAPCFFGFDQADRGVLGCGAAVQANTPRGMQLDLLVEWY